MKTQIIITLLNLVSYGVGETTWSTILSSMLILIIMVLISVKVVMPLIILIIDLIKNKLK